MPDHVSIPAGTLESRDLYAKIQRGIRLTERLNAIPGDDAGALGAAWSELTGQAVAPTFPLIPPVHVQHGLSTRLGRNVFINQGCTLMDIGGLDLGDDVMIRPEVSPITGGHPPQAARRR